MTQTNNETETERPERIEGNKIADGPIREALIYYRDHHDLNKLQRSHAERALRILDADGAWQRLVAASPEQGHEPWPGTPGAQNEDSARLDALARLFRACPHSRLIVNDDPDMDEPVGWTLRTEGCETVEVTGTDLRDLLDKQMRFDAARGVQPAAHPYDEPCCYCGTPMKDHDPYGMVGCTTPREIPAAQEPRSMLKRIRDAHEKSKGSKLHFGPAAQESAPAAEQVIARWQRRIEVLKNQSPNGPSQKTYHQGLIDAHKDCIKDVQGGAPSPAAQKKPETASVLREILDIVTGYGNNPPSLWRVEEYCRAALATASPEEKE